MTARRGALRDAGANLQRPLWASTAIKNPAYSDVLYVEALIAPDIVNTMPEATLHAFAEHGEIGASLSPDASAAEQTLSDAQAAGIDLDSLTAALEHEGVRSFSDSYQQLIVCIETKLAHPGWSSDNS
jgi:transaldolase